MSKAHVFAGPAARVAGLPACWFQHGLPGRWDPIDRVAAVIPAAAVFAPSRTVAEAQDAIRPRRGRTLVVSPGVDGAAAAAVGRRPGRERLADAGVPPGATVIGMVARLQRWKGVHVAIEALPALLVRHPSARLVVVGGEHPLEPGYRDELVAVAERLGVRDRVHLVGFQPDPLAWMACMDVVVHASDLEPLGLVVLEAMAVGRPLVAGARGGPSEIITDGVDGLLAEFGNAEALAGQVMRYLDDPSFAARVTAAGRDRAAAFTPERFADQLVAHLSSVTTRHDARGVTA